MLIDHLESFCSPIRQGTSADPAGRDDALPAYLNGVRGMTTFCTLGLSNHPLKSVGSDKIVQLELLKLAYRDAVPPNLTRHTSPGRS
jgi:hypothetical protein